jgi:drug/metabolite transporter (DMT)-like permease
VSHLAWGLVLAVVSVSMYSCGMVVETLATRRLPSVHARQSKQMIFTLCRDPLWLIGFVLLMLGLGVQVIALTLAPISIVQAIAACGIAVFLILAHFVLSETLQRIEYVGLGALLISMVLLGLSIDSHNDTASSTTSIASLLSTALPAILVGVLLFLTTDQLNASSGRKGQLKAPLYGVSSGLLYGAAALGVKEMSTIVKQFGMVDAVPRFLTSPGFYLYLISTALGFLVFQTALQRTTASVFVPVNNATSSSFFIITGTILFHERLPTSGEPLILRLGAFALILVGLFVLASGNKANEPALTPEPANGA